MKDLSMVLIKYKEENQKTQIDMAKMFKVSLSSYRNWECGVTTPSESSMKRIKEILEVEE